MEIFCSIMNVFVTFDQFNASLLNKNINFLKRNLTGPNLLNGSVYFIFSYSSISSTFDNAKIRENE